MKEIRFRIRNTKTDKWVHGPNYEVNLFGETILLGGFMKGVGVLELNDCVALQYTGLTDSNEKEIYAGDILKISYGAMGDVIGQVLYEADHGGYLFQWNRKGPNQNYINLNCDVAFEAVIVGNIFDNPELLK